MAKPTVKKEKFEEVHKKCPKGAHHFFPSLDPWYLKCQFCPALKKVTSIKVKSVK